MMTSEILEFIVRGALSVSVAVALVLILRGPICRAFGARVAYAFWVLVPVALLANFLPAQQIIITESTPTPVAEQSVHIPSAIASVPAKDAAAFKRLMAQVKTDVSSMRLAENRPPQPQHMFSDFSVSDVVPLLVAFWIAGAFFSLGALIIKQHRFLREHGLKNIKRRFHVAAREDIGPVVIGILKPFIVVPKSFEKKFNKVERNLILAHEREHIRSGDLRVNAFAAIVQCLNWFNPFVHYAMRAFRVDQELACDERVMKRHGQHRRLYGAALLKSQIGMQSAPLGCMWGSAGASPLKQRLALLAQPKMTTARRGMGAALCLMSAMAVGTAAWATLPAEYKVVTTQDMQDGASTADTVVPNMTFEKRKDIAVKALKDARASIPTEAEIEAIIEASMTAEKRSEIAAEAVKLAKMSVPTEAEIEAIIEASMTAEKRSKIAAQAVEAALASLPSEEEIQAQVEAALEETMVELERAEAEAEKAVEEANRENEFEVIIREKVLAEIKRAKAEVKRANADARREIAFMKREGKAQMKEAIRHLRSEGTIYDAKGVALVDAIDRRRDDKARALIEDGANVNYVAHGDGTPLMIATRRGKEDLVRLLIEKGADVNGYSHGDGNALIIAAYRGEEDIARMLIEAGADVNAGVPGDGTPLIAAISRGDDDIVKMLLDAGADVNVAEEGDGNPLIAAAKRGDVDVARLLVERGADVNGFVMGDETPLINAAQQGHMDVAEYLIEQGADVNLAVERGGFFDGLVGNNLRTPLGQAERNGHLKMAALLRKHGARDVPAED